MKSQKWLEAKEVFKAARKIPGYEYNNKTAVGIKSARGGADAVLKNEKPGKS